MKRSRSHVRLCRRVLLALTVIAGLLAVGLASAGGAAADPVSPATGVLDPAVGSSLVTVDPTAAPVDPAAAPVDPAAAPVDAAAAAAPPVNDNISETDCRNAYAAHHLTDPDPQGWAKTHFAACTWRVAVARALYYPRGYPGPSQVIGALTFDLYDLNEASNSGPYVTHTEIADNFRPSGVISGLSVTLQTACSNSQATSGNCSPQTSSPFTLTATQLLALGKVSIPTVFDVAPGANQDGISFNYTQTTGTSTVACTGSNCGPPSSSVTPQTGFRCDYALSHFPNPGCVIDWAPPEIFHLSLSDPLAGPSAHLIQNAQGDPRIPGAPSSGKPLTRTWDPNIIAANRTEAKALCLQQNPFYTRPIRGRRQSCDEYPFASTLQGAILRTAVVAYAIDDTANSSAGGYLASFYRQRRILGDPGANDPFYVEIDP